VGPDDGHRLRAEFNVAIRTVTIDTEEGLARYGVGGAITWDSSPRGEYEEARLKGQLLVERRPAFELMETMRWESDRGFWWQKQHLERLAQSADYFGFLLDLGELDAALDQYVAPTDEATKVRLKLARTGEFDMEASGVVEPFCRDFAAARDVRAAVAAEPVSSQNVFLFHKTTNRDAYKRRLKRYPSAADVILVNQAGFVTESTTANVAVRRVNAWATPPIDHGLLGGIYRSRLLAEGVLVEDAITREELVAADEVALLNSVRGWSRARLLG
jgi:para-aminobenzoate synthetase/4-amino-4-deoxychorismate lyase